MPPDLHSKHRLLHSRKSLRKFPRALIRKSLPHAGKKSPRVRARMAELQLTTADLAGIMGTGASNRVTIKDLENFLHKIENQTAHEASAIRAGVADAMRRSWTRPLSTIGSSVNLDPALKDRQSRDPKPGL